jgi:glycosyltransferase involved in cell wall biosynthesis
MVRELGLGGSERQMAELAMALNKNEFAAHVGCFRAHGFRADELRQAGIPILALPVRSLVRFNALQGAWEMGRYIRQHKIQLVHTFDLPLTCFGVPVAKAFGVPTVLSSQRADRSLHPGSRRLARFTDHLVQGIIANCEEMRRHLIEDEGVPDRLIHVCYNWIDLDHYRPMPKLNPDGIVIGVVCALRPEKDLRTLIDAFALVRAPGLKLMIVGGGPMRESLEARAREHGLGEQCRFQDAASDVRVWLREMDIFVLPSVKEAFSNSLMEAMACGVAVVASNVGGNPELVKDGETGLLFKVGDAQDLARQLRALVSDEDLRRRLAANGESFVRTRFGKDISVERMETVYRSFLGRRA